jgi:hypothetical protein
MSVPSSGSKDNPSTIPGSKFATCFMLVSRLAYPPTMEKEAACSSEKSFDFLRNTRRYIPEERTLNTNIRLCRLWSCDDTV